MKFKAGKFLLAGIACLAMTAATYADAATLRVTVSARGNQRAVWQSAFDQFEKANPDVDLKVTYVGEEAYKVQMSGWLATDPPDVLSWHNGERMAYFAKRGLLDDLSADWQKDGWNQTYAAVKPPSTYAGKQYAAPLATTRTDSFTARTCSRKRALRTNPRHGTSFSPTARS
jgi:multiple sugar transport system substrate-binding protein